MVWTPPRRVISTTTSLSVNQSDGSSFVNYPNTYKGNNTFNTLTAVRNSIDSVTGGFKPLTDGTAGVVDAANLRITGRTILRPAIITQADGTAAGYYGTLGGTTRVYYTPSSIYSVWGGGLFNGHAFFVGVNGGHQAWYGNDLYMIRVADPVGAFCIHKPAPVACVTTGAETVNGYTYVAGQIMRRTDWYTGSSENKRPIGAWGPMTQHNYSGWGWDAATEQIVFTGDAQINITNMYDELAQAISNGVIWTFNVNAPTPKAAWGTPHVFAPHGGKTAKAGYSVVRNADGTFGFRSTGYYNDANSGYNVFYLTVTGPGTATVTIGQRPPGVGAPALSDGNGGFASTVRDPITNKYYEFYPKGRGYDGATGGYWHTFGLYEIINGTRVERLKMWDQFGNGTRTYYNGFDRLPWNIQNGDRVPGMVVRDGVAYVWPGTNRVLRVDMRDTANVTFTEYVGNDTTEPVTPDPTYNGIFGRWGYHESTGAFLGASSTEQDIWVFRPPASWGVT